jgi:predicted PurR-regulated permease PerM
MTKGTSHHSTLLDNIARLLGTALVIGMLYYGREVLVPITLAVFLSFAVAPCVWAIQRTGLGRAPAVAIVVGLFCLLLCGATLLLGSQLVRMAGSMPQYETTIRSKLQALDELTLGRMNVFIDHADKMVRKLSTSTQESLPTPPRPATRPSSRQRAVAPDVGGDNLEAYGESTNQALLVRVVQPPPSPQQIIFAVLDAISGPLATAGIVLVVLIFLLLDYESLRDRIIRLLGGDNLRGTTTAVNDAGARLSRYFISQLTVNTATGVFMALLLFFCGLPGALFWGCITTASRFIPYVGAWLAMIGATLFAAAISPDWLLCVETAVLYITVELVVSQLIEPKLYGHTTGLSALSVVIATIFWSSLWGGVGLFLATPLTLCLVVIGHYVPSLHFLELLLGDISGLTVVQNFYQRALSGDSSELIRGLRKFLKQNPLSQYCDQVLHPSMAMAYREFSSADITTVELANMRRAIRALIGVLEAQRVLRRRRNKPSVLNTLQQGPRTHSRMMKSFFRAVGCPVEETVSIPVSSMPGAFGEISGAVLAAVLRSESMHGYKLTSNMLESETAHHHPAASVACVAASVPDTNPDTLARHIAILRERTGAKQVFVLLLLASSMDVEMFHAQLIGADGVVTSYQELAQMCRAIVSPTIPASV